MIFKLFLFFYFLSSILFSFEYVEHRELIIKESKKKIIIIENVEKTYKYNNRETLNQRNFYIWEGHTETIRDIKLTINKSSISKKYLNYYYPKSQDSFITDDKIYYFSLPKNPRLNDVVKITYSRSIRDIAFIPIYRIPKMDFLKEYSITINHPKFFDLSLEYVSTANKHIPEIEKAKNRTKFMLREIPATPRLDYFHFNSHLGFLMPKISKDGELLSPHSPSKINHWYSQQVNLKKVNFTTPKDLKIETSLSPIEKTKKIHNYVKKKIRYVSDARKGHAYIPKAPSEVLSIGYGDCKDRAYMLYAFGQKFNLPIKMALINTKLQPNFLDHHLFMYNHVISYYDDGSSKLFFDATAAQSPFPIVPSIEEGQRVLILGDEGAEAYVPYAENFFDYSIKIFLKNDNQQKAKAFIQLKGDYFQSMQKLRESYSGLRLDRLMEDLVDGVIENTQFESIKILNEAEDSLLLEGIIDLGELLIQSKKYTYLPTIPISTMSTKLFDRERDPYPIHLNKAHSIKVQIETPHLPSSKIKKDIFLSGDDLVSYRVKTKKVSTNKTLIVYELKQRDRVVQLEKKNAYIKFWEDIYKNKSNLIEIPKY